VRQMHEHHERERWATRIGLVLAMAGNAIGLGNFLRFPTKAAQNGGGAFMIPYLIALLFMGIPLMWVEWSIGRRGGGYGHGTTPGMFHRLWHAPASKYLGVLGIVLPTMIGLYYIYVESWCLGFAFYSLTGKYFGAATSAGMGSFLRGYQHVETNEYFSSFAPALIFFGLTFLFNAYIMRRGLSRGIELLAKVGVPTLLVLAVVLLVRVLTLGTPDPSFPERNVSAGLAFVWVPAWGKLADPTVWVTAAGQVFFTLSLGLGIVQSFASHVRHDEDIALSGLATVGTNEMAEVILGGTIAIPATVVFFGAAQARLIAEGGSFNLAFQTMPVIFQQMAGGRLFGTMWFLLLFLAGATSSVALFRPAVVFFQEELKYPRQRATGIVCVGILVFAMPTVLFLKHGFLDEMDFWAGTIGLALFAFIEVIVFCWLFGIEKGWDELHRGAELRVPNVFRYVFKYVTPLLIGTILTWWIVTDGVDTFLMKGKDAADKPYLWAARALIVGMFLFFAWGIRRATKRGLFSQE